MRHMEIAGADDLLLIEKDDRIVGGRVELDGECRLEPRRFGIGCAMDLRHAAEGQRILEAPRLHFIGAKIGERQELITSFDFARLRPGARRLGRERHAIAAEADKSERARDLKRGHGAMRTRRGQ